MASRDERIEELTLPDLQLLTKEQAKEIRQLKETQGILMSRIRQFITSFPFGLIILRMDQRIKALNKIAVEYFQYTDHEVSKLSVSDLFPEFDRFEVAHPNLRLMARKKSGEVFATEVFVNLLEMEGEELLFISVQDINEKHRLEQLRRDLMAMVSHDLRAPLTSLRVTLEMISEGTYGDLSERGRDLVEHGVTSIEYLNGLVEHLLQSEKAEGGSIELNYQETSIGKIVKMAINSVHAPDQKSTVCIETEITNDVITVDEDRIVQVLINLLGNALKYSPAGSRVTVVAGIEGVYAKFQVVDQGPGIPVEMRSVIFERYRQLEQPKGTKRRGFGLGLAICKALVEKHGGRIWVESQQGQGSKFAFTVPISNETR